MLLRAAALLLLVACHPDAQPVRCTPAPAGDASLPVELLPISTDAQGALHAVHDGDTVLLQQPPQGGYVVYAGAAARNLQPCAALLTAQLLDPATRVPSSNLDQRQVDFTVSSAGYFWPENGYTQTANIGACPDALHHGVVGRAAILHVDVKDAAGRAASLEVNVTPVCPPGDAKCACVCGPNPSGC